MSSDAPADKKATAPAAASGMGAPAASATVAATAVPAAAAGAAKKADGSGKPDLIHIPQFLPLTEDLANTLAEFSDAIAAGDVYEAERLYEVRLPQTSSSSLSAWRREQGAALWQQIRSGSKSASPNPYPPVNKVRDYITDPTAEALYTLLHVREGQNRVGAASYRKSTWEAFLAMLTALTKPTGAEGVPASLMFDLVDEICYQLQTHCNHAVRQRNKFIGDLAAAKVAAAAAAAESPDSSAVATPVKKEPAPAAAVAAAADEQQQTTAAIAAANNIRAPDYDSLPQDVWSVGEALRIFQDIADKSGARDVIKQIVDGKLPATALFPRRRNMQQVDKNDEKKKAQQHQAQLPKRAKAVIGFMALFGVLRLSVATGDYSTALRVSKQLALEKTGPALAESVARAHTAIFHNTGAALMMSRRYSDAVAVLLCALQYGPTPFRKYHDAAQLSVWGLTQICSVLADVPIPDYSDRFTTPEDNRRGRQQSQQQREGEDVLVPLRAGEVNKFKDVFVASMPKFIAVGIDLRTPAMELASHQLYELNPHDVLEVQVRMFLREVQQLVDVLQLRSSLRVYSAFPLEKVTQLSGSAAAAEAAAAMAAAATASATSPVAAGVGQVIVAPNPRADAIGELVNLKTKALQLCEMRSTTLNPDLIVPGLSNSGAAAASSVDTGIKLRCAAAVDFSSDSKTVNVCRYNATSTTGCKLADRLLQVTSGKKILN